MKSLKKLLFAAALATVITGIATPLPAQEKKSPPAADSKEGKPKKSPDSLPFNGKVVAVDKAAMSFTLSGEKARVVTVTSATKINKGGKEATFSDITVGDQVGGAYKKNGDKLDAIVVRVGPKPEVEGKAKGKEK